MAAVIATSDLNGVFAVPPLPRKTDAQRSLNLDAAECVARHIEAGGITRFLYGGKALPYHASLRDFRGPGDRLSGGPATRPAAASIRPSFERAHDPAPAPEKEAFPARVILPP